MKCSLDISNFIFFYIFYLFGCGRSLLQHAGSLVVVQGLSCPMACGILVQCLVRDWTRIPCIARQSLNPWTTREVPPIFLKRKSSRLSWRKKVFPILLFSHSTLSLYFFAMFTEEGLLLAILWNSAFSWVYFSLSSVSSASLPFSAIYKSSSHNHFAFSHFFLFRMVLVTASCTMFQPSVHGSSGTLATRSNPLYLFVTSTI